MQKMYKLDPLFKQKIWGGNKIKDLIPKASLDKIGEAWLLCDHEQGKNLPKEIDDSFLGKKLISSKTNKLNLLLKLISSDDFLSIQVHPSNNYTKLKETELGKAEVWYILDAEEDSKIIYGLKQGSNLNALTDSLKNDTILKELNELKVSKGDIIYIPPGTIHAIGKGILLLEIQQNSDTTYRLYDFNRPDLDGNLRELHIENSLDVIDFNQMLSIEKSNLWIVNKWWKVISNEFFYVSEQLVHGEVVEQQSPESMSILYCISGALEIASETEKLSMTAGETIIVSAGIGKYKLSGNAHIVRTMGA